MKTEIKQRIKRVALLAALFIIIGILYAVIISLLNFGIPCVFYKITGLRCPGCGMTRSILALIKFDVYGAIKYNAFSFFIIAYILCAFVCTSKEYILYGKYRLNAGKEFISIIFLVLLLLWFVVRNILGI